MCTTPSIRAPASSWVDSESEGVFVHSLDGCVCTTCAFTGGRVLQFDSFGAFAQLENLNSCWSRGGSEICEDRDAGSGVGGFRPRLVIFDPLTGAVNVCAGRGSLLAKRGHRWHNPLSSKTDVRKDQPAGDKDQCWRGWTLSSTHQWIWLTDISH